VVAASEEEGKRGSEKGRAVTAGSLGRKIEAGEGKNNLLGREVISKYFSCGRIQRNCHEK